MHEASVTASIVDAVLEELKNHEFSKVNAVNVVIGDLTQLGAEQMQFAYSVLTEGTALEGSAFNIVPEHVKLRCRECGYEGEPKTVDFGPDSYEHSIPVLACPKCGGPVDILEGESCRIRDIDIEEKEESQR